MSGDFESLAGAAVQLLPPGPRRDLAYEVLMWLLENQFVTCECAPDRAWQVRKGSGMGLPHSGPVAEAAFCVLVEQPWASRSEALEAALRIRLHCKFKDDIFAVVRRTGTENYLAAHYFLRGVQSRARCIFDVALESISAREVCFLGLRVFKRSGQICVAPKVRDVGSPVLDHTSSHNPCTKMWPVGFLKSQLKLCTHNDDRAQVAAHIIERFRFQGSPQSLINALESVDVTASLPPPRRVGGESKDVVWLTTSFHPLLQACLRSAVSRFVGSADSTVLRKMCSNRADFDVGVSFRRGGWSLQSLSSFHG